MRITLSCRCFYCCCYCLFRASALAYLPDVILAVTQIPPGKEERPRADVDVGIQLGEAAHVPLQLLPLVAVETHADLAVGEWRRRRGGGEGSNPISRVINGHATLESLHFCNLPRNYMKE